jgi:hypothetical protein
MTKQSVLRWAWNASRVGVGFLFLLAASGKFRDPIKFMGGIDAYQVVHGWTIPLGAVTLPGMELLAALALLAAWQVKAGSLMISGQLLIFIAAMGSALYRKLELDCGCFDLAGADPSLLAYGPAVRDLMLTGLALGFQFFSDSAWQGPARRWGRWVVLALFVWVAFGLLGPGHASWQLVTRGLLGLSLLAWLALGLRPALAAGVDWRGLLLPLVPTGLLMWLVLHLLGDGAATLGWGTIFRDVLMLLPALWLAVYAPRTTR